VQVDGASNTIVDFDVEFWQDVFRVNAGLRDIPHSGTLDHVPHGKPLDGLVLRGAPRAIRASDELDMATAVLVTTIISSFLSHFVE